MSRRPSHNLIALCWCVVLACVPLAAAQSPPADRIADDSADGVLETFLRARSLNDLLAEHLRARLERTSGKQRVEVAERLGRVYAEMLSAARTGTERDGLIRASGELLERVPGADTFDLRIALTKSRYLTAEQTAERARLGLAGDEARLEAVEAFESISAGLALLGGRADRRVRALERRERTGGVSDLAGLRADLAEARRQRSLAKYYAGWSLYYTAMMTGEHAGAGDAIKEFGYLLGAEGGEPTLDSMPRSLLRYEHVARSAMGVALCHALRGDHALAVLWLGELEKSGEVHPGVLAQMFTRKVTVLASARRWDALARAVILRRGVGLDEKASNPLRVNEARLLAVEVLDAVRAPDADARRREAAEPLVRAAMSDLVASGASAQVLDLVERYGTLPLGDQGFIARYVRGLRAFRAARDLHSNSAEDDTRPTREPSLVAAYVEAVDLLTHAFESDDAGTFDEEHGAIGLMLGMALYYKDNPEQAADRFEQTTRLAHPGRQHAEALWMSIVSLERAIEQGRADLQSRLHSAAVVYVRTYVGDDRSARLLLRFAGSGLFDQEMLLSVLMDVEPGSSLYIPARRHAADVLYRAYAGASEPARSELAARFLPSAFELIELALRDVRSASAKTDDVEAVDAAVLRIRQVLDAALTPLATDAESGRRALAALAELRTRTGRDIDSELGGELAYRRLQLAIAVGDDDAQRSAHRELETIGGRFLDAADRFLFSRAHERWRRTRGVDDARRVVEIGLRLIGDEDLDRSMLTIADTCARGATALWEGQGDRAMLRAAIDLDERVRRHYSPTADLLRRLGRNAESAGELELAFEAWTSLSSSIRDGEGDWFEARYEALRVLAGLRPDEARAAIRQHKVLYPKLGPSPWDDRFAQLESRLTRESGGGGP